jgi:hypothetical protein
MFYAAVALVVLLQLAGVLSYSGVDLSARTYQSSFECLDSNGYHFVCVRVYQSSGHCDSNGPATIKDAWNGGMKYVDGYIFPSYSVDPKKQVLLLLFGFHVFLSDASCRLMILLTV